mmetsp:Transcript_122624/g.261692  ORF Transcript_122624/g.261692 Transcript_122624/m.261692 type:complete len:321 (-) Transcript_122624:42-1004(-)
MSGADQGTTQTVLFVDIDGVLNVGIRDGPRSPIGFSKRNVDYALAIQRAGKTHRDKESLERLLAVHARPVGHGEDSHYADYVSDTSTECADVFAKRLAMLISAAGKGRLVVLSSTWRQPHHHALVAQLETVISSHLGCRFTFDARTPLTGEDRTAEGRLKVMGDFLAARFRDAGEAVATKLRVLVLEDFHITPLDGCFACDSVPMDSREAVENYLCKRALVPAEVRLIHTYDAWHEPNGTNVQIGCGLTDAHFERAASFLAERPNPPTDSFPFKEAQEEDINISPTYLKANNLDSPVSPLASIWRNFPEFWMPSSPVPVI